MFHSFTQSREDGSLKKRRIRGLIATTVIIRDSENIKFLDHHLVIKCDQHLEILWCQQLRACVRSTVLLKLLLWTKWHVRYVKGDTSRSSNSSEVRQPNFTPIARTSTREKSKKKFNPSQTIWNFVWWSREYIPRQYKDCSLACRSFLIILRRRGSSLISKKKVCSTSPVSRQQTLSMSKLSSWTYERRSQWTSSTWSSLRTVTNRHHWWMCSFRDRSSTLHVVESSMTEE